MIRIGVEKKSYDDDDGLNNKLNVQRDMDMELYVVFVCWVQGGNKIGKGLHVWDGGHHRDY